MEFPLWAMRSYYEIETAGTCRYVLTYRNKYILDDTSIPGDYLRRRAVLQTSEQEFKVYPLKYKFDNPVQIYIHRKTVGTSAKFIDRTGKILTYKPSKYVDVECKPCKCYTVPGQPHYVAVAKGEPYHFNVAEPVAYLALVTWLGSRLVLETYAERPENLRYRRLI